MRIHVRILAILLFFVVPGFASVAFSQTTGLSLNLVENRIDTLREGGAEDADEVLKAYVSVQSWLNLAASHRQRAITFLAALENAAPREAEILARIDTLGATKQTQEQLLDSLQGLTREALEAQLTLLRTDLRNATSSLDAIEQRLAARESNANQIRTRLGEIPLRLNEIDNQDLTIHQNAPPSLAEGLQWISVAERQALDAERRFQEARLSSQSARYRILQAESAELKQLIENLTVQAGAVGTMARSKALRVPETAETGIDTDHPLYSIVSRLQSGNRNLRELRLEVEVLNDEAAERQKVVDRTLRALGERFANARRVVDFASGSDQLGKVLLAYWQEIERFRLPEPTQRIQEEIGDTVIRRINHEQEAAEDIDSSVYIGNLIKTEGLDPDEFPTAVNKTLIELADTKRELLKRMIAVESNYIGVLSELEAGHARLTRLTDEYQKFLGALILWIPSRQPLWESDLRTIPEEIGRLRDAAREIQLSATALPILWLIFAGFLVSMRTRLGQAQHALNKQIIRVRDDSIFKTVAALILTALRAAPGPLLVHAMSTFFSQESSAMALALTTALSGLAMVYFALSLVRLLCAEAGVARTHFGWPRPVCDRLLEETKWLTRWWLPVATIAAFLYLMNDVSILLGRLSLILAISIIITRLAGPVLQVARANSWKGMFTGSNALRLALTGILLVVVAGIVWGLRYSVGIFTSRLLITFLTSIALVILHNLLLRTLRVVRRRLYLSERLASQAGNQNEEISTAMENQVNLLDIGTDAARLLKATTITAAIVAMLYLWAPLLPVFDAFERVTLWTSSGLVDGEKTTTRITLETLIVVGFLASMTFYALRKLPALVELTLRARTDMNPGTRYTTSTLLSYVIAGIGIVAAFSALGVRWSELQWLVAAMGVGIGFGLQEIIANFISGLIILFERPIRVGDVVTVGDKEGTVTKIRIRATTILDFDGKELLVPNKEFITGRLLNWTLSEPIVRLIVPVGIAYGSNVEQALEILRAVADDNPSILNEPAPSIVFCKFGDNSLDLVARFYIGSVEDRWPVITNVHADIYNRFKEAGISIAFPQQDVHFDSADPIRIVIDPPSEK